MYVLLMILLAAPGVWLLATGIRRRNAARALAGAGAALAVYGAFRLLDLWGEMLWFEALDQSQRFWTVLGTQAGATLLGAICAGLCVFLLTWLIRSGDRGSRLWPVGLAAIAGASWGWSSWDTVFLFWNGTTTGLEDPVLGLDTGFYLFTLPLLERLMALAGWIALVVAIALVVTALDWRRLRSWTPEREVEALVREQIRTSSLRTVGILNGFLGLLVVGASALGAFHVLYSDWGVVAGPGWTDVHVRLPAYWVVGVAGVLLAATSPVLARGRGYSTVGSTLRTTALSWSVVGACWLLGLHIVPGLVQWLVVEPNEITFEKPYIGHNIRFTRDGFRLDDVEDRLFPADDEFDREVVRQNEHLLSEVRLWDYRALDAVLKQFQEIRLYYEFYNVDVDRYRVGDRYRQVMVSARELRPTNLPSQSQTFVNRRFKYTHGYGLTLATVSDFTRNGLPNLLVKDFPPSSATPGLEVDRPQIYYGELTDEPAIVNSTEEEFDYPSGDRNAYIRYPGSGGVSLANLWRKFVFGWKFDGSRLLLSSYPREESRILFRRQIRERVGALAPFLELDEDPYITIVDGRLYWIIDAYTTSRRYPYSEPFSGAGVAISLDGVNYVRNSVKAVVDAFEGTVDLYVFEPDDPVIRAWRRGLPGLFRNRDEMPEGLRAHVRYPVDLLLAQGIVYAKYHMTDPAVFYNQEDLWVRATEKYYSGVQPVEPYYVMWQQPGSDRAEFVLILPFTPKNRQVLIGWIAGLCDGENYGRLLAYKFSKEKRLLGPQQVETKIDQDRFLSGQLTLWDQRGSKVIRGNVLALPLANTLLYVEPIYLQAETAAYPELRLVVVMHGDTLAYGESLDEALNRLLEGGREDGMPSSIGKNESSTDLARRANEAFERYLELQGEKRFVEAARELNTLRELLERLAGGESPEPSSR